MAVREQWVLEQHCCRSCFGRVVSREIRDDDLNRVYRCTNCGLEAEGRRADVICACGMKLHTKGKKGVDVGLRCHENQVPSPEFPSQIVASIMGVQS